MYDNNSIGRKHFYYMMTENIIELVNLLQINVIFPLLHYLLHHWLSIQISYHISTTSVLGMLNKSIYVITVYINRYNIIVTESYVRTRYINESFMNLFTQMQSNCNLDVKTLIATKHHNMFVVGRTVVMPQHSSPTINLTIFKSLHNTISWLLLWLTRNRILVLLTIRHLILLQTVTQIHP